MPTTEPSDQLEEKGFGKLLSVSFISLLLCGATALYGLIKPAHICGASQAITSFCLESLDWFFLLSCALFLGVNLFLALSRYGRIKLGKPDEEPEFSTTSWIAMLFAAGMGAGLLFWGVAEPLSHFMAPPFGVEGMTPEAARQAMVLANLHWGLHAWGIYSIGALCLAYFGFRKGYPLLASTPIKVAFSGRFGDYLGGVADVVAILSVVFGVAGSLGLGVMQISSGLNLVFNTPDQTIGMWLAILACLTISYMLSAGTSLDKGIKILSNINMAIAIVLMLFVLFIGPTGFILSTFITSVGDYLFRVVPLSFRLNPYSGDTAWTCGWTLTYLIWWIAWAPFVGIFVARISRGRTIRQFVTAVILVPSIFTALWFATLGGTGLHIELFGGGGLGTLVLEDVSKALFEMFQFFPLSNVLCIIAIVLQFVFLVTSADSASFVLGMMTTKGSLNPSTPRKLFWAVIIAVLTTTTIIAGGGVKLMKAIAISGAIPFIVIMILHIACLMVVISKERIPVPRAARRIGPVEGKEAAS